jgi:hypothetical protein
MKEPSLAMLVAGEGAPPGESPDEPDTGAMGEEAAAAEVMDAVQTGDPGAFRRSLSNFVRLVVSRLED